MRPRPKISDLTLAAALVACSVGADDLTNPMPEPQEPPWSCGDSGTDGCQTATGLVEQGTSDGPWDGDGACMSSDDCPSGVCIADFIDRERRPFECVATCIGIMDEAHWCADDAACCDPRARCSNRGYCIVDDDPDTSSTSGSTDDPTSGADTTG